MLQRPALVVVLLLACVLALSTREGEGTEGGEITAEEGCKSYQVSQKGRAGGTKGAIQLASYTHICMHVCAAYVLIHGNNTRTTCDTLRGI